jgi:endonuclease/exonuclease/phosphatase family metal-dependent hydrolase
MRLRFLTLNVWALPEPLSADLDGRLHRIGEQLPLLGADVAALQEVWTPKARRQLAAAAHRAGYPHVWHNRASLRSSGLMLLSRLPLHQPRFRRFALGGLPQRLHHGDFYGGKGFVLVELATPEHTLSLINTHLVARYQDREGPDEYRGHRAAQVVEIAAAVNRRPEPVVALGDFNIREGQPEYRVLLGLTGLRDAAADLDRRQPTVARDRAEAAPRPSREERIDFVFARRGVTSGATPVRIQRVFDEDLGQIRRARAYSDHCGLLAEIEIDGSPGTSHRPDPEALELARELLARGAELARQRRNAQRRLSVAGAGVALGLLVGNGRLGDGCLAPDRPGDGCLAPNPGDGRRAPDRRSLLRAALLTGAGAAFASSAVAVALAEIFAPTELAGFERAEAILAELRAAP